MTKGRALVMDLFNGFLIQGTRVSSRYPEDTKVILKIYAMLQIRKDGVLSSIKDLLQIADFCQLSLEKTKIMLFSLICDVGLELTLFEKVLIFDRVIRSAAEREDCHKNDIFDIARLLFGTINLELHFFGKELPEISAESVEHFNIFLCSLDKHLAQCEQAEDLDDDYRHGCEKVQLILHQVANKGGSYRQRESERTSLG